MAVEVWDPAPPSEPIAAQFRDVSAVQKGSCYDTCVFASACKPGGTVETNMLHAGRSASDWQQLDHFRDVVEADGCSRPEIHNITTFHEATNPVAKSGRLARLFGRLRRSSDTSIFEHTRQAPHCNHPDAPAMLGSIGAQLTFDYTRHVEYGYPDERA